MSSASDFEHLEPLLEKKPKNDQEKGGKRMDEK